MERLTEYSEKYGGYIVKGDFVFPDEAITKLASYEEAEEQGLLLRLPCKVGDEVYRVVRRKYGGCFVRVVRLDRNTFYRVVIDGDFGKTVFLTKAEAETALEEMECVE